MKQSYKYFAVIFVAVTKGTLAVMVYYYIHFF